MSHRLVALILALALAPVCGCQTMGSLAMQAPKMVICGVVGMAKGPQPSSRPARLMRYEGGRRIIRRTTRLPLRAVAHRQQGTLQEALSLYNECDYERCLQASLRVAKDRTVPANDRAVAWVYAGAVLYLIDRREEASECFQRARRIAPTCSINPDLFKPDVVASFNAAGHRRR